MVDERTDQRTRQIYASIREDIYLAAKARAAELRMPLKRFIEVALESVLAGEGIAAQPDSIPSPVSAPSIWDDEYLRMQVQQPVGAPVKLTREEAERVVQASFGAGVPVSEDASDG
jgi:hypothetical protein